MGELVNLRAARKRAKRRQAEQEAATRRVRFGRSKAERTLEETRGDKAQKNLDQHRIDKGDGS